MAEPPHQISAWASMRPAHYAREVSSPSLYLRRGGQASMRPAHYAREVQQILLENGLGDTGFNEARALCAGSPQFGWGIQTSGRSFNEARALCAGSPDACQLEVG